MIRPLEYLIVWLCLMYAIAQVRAVEVACYYFPNWGPSDESEWSKVKSAPARFPEHQQPKVPDWGYQNEQDPEVMAQKIAAAADHGIDAFLFCHYHFDSGPYLRQALDSGFLHAPNNHRLKFALMWANHDVKQGGTGKVLPETFEQIVKECVNKYFPQPSYWKIQGKPFFSIYLTTKFIESFGGITQAAEAIESFRQQALAKGFPGVHVDLVLWGLPHGEELPPDKVAEQLGADSLTTYTWIHHLRREGFPTTEYNSLSTRYFRSLTQGGESNGLESPMTRSSVPYYPNVMMGWDSSPRCAHDNEQWLERRGYPNGSVVVNNTAPEFKQALLQAREYARQFNVPAITINAWNEWGEGSYLEPEQRTGMAYLEAVREVFADPTKVALPAVLRQKVGSNEGP